MTRALLCLILFASLAHGQEPKKADAPLILFPQAPVVPVAPSSPVKLGADQSFVVRANVKLVVVASPEGVVNVTAETGPIRSRGRFTDGSGKVETKTFTEKHVYFVEALTAGRCELIIITDVGEVVRKTLDVGGGPLPPDPGPKPPDPPDPKPSPVPIPELGFRALFIYESGDLEKYPNKAVLTSQEIRQYLNAKCATGPDGKTPERRFWDKDTDVSGESKLWQVAMQRPRTSLPWLIISNGRTGYEGPVPANIAKTLELLKKYGD